MKNFSQWEGFKGNRWKEKIDVRNFISMNYTPYDGDASFLEEPTEATNKLWGKLQELQKEERAKGGVLDMETEVVTSLTAYGPGYIDKDLKDLEKVVGLQTDKPLKRAFMPYGGIKMAEQSCETYGYKPSEKLHEIFTKYHKTHNQGVFDIYTPEMMKARHNKILTGLPDTYGRGRIVGDYRRVALYGIDYLIERKKADFAATNRQGMRRGDFQLREEIADQVRALQDMKVMAQSYGYDISEPAKNAREAVQWLYFGYLAAIKTQNGAAMSVGRVSTFLDIYIERDIEKGILTEKEAQELIDHLVMKFRMVKFARIPSYNQLFSGDPVWATLEVGGIGVDGRSMVTKTDYRFLHTLENMGPSPEPNMTVLYSSMQLMSSLYAETAKGSCVWEECMDGARHMCDLLDDLTELNNGNQLNRASFPLGHVLRNSAVLFAMSLNFEKSKIEMTSSIDKNIKRFNGDRTKLEEVFLNILTNAKDALADCKYAPRLQFRAKKLDDKILIQCQDNGCGIPTEIVDKLYEPFFTTKENGTGLGLAVSKRIIEAHNGTIDITSDHTNGTIVSITLPA